MGTIPTIRIDSKWPSTAQLVLNWFCSRLAADPPGVCLKVRRFRDHREASGREPFPFRAYSLVPVFLAMVRCRRVLVSGLGLSRCFTARWVSVLPDGAGS